MSDIEEVFRLNKEREVYKFCKDYALQNEEFAAALIKHFLPKKEERKGGTKLMKEIDRELKACFQHISSNDNSWGPELDWYAIDADLYKFIEKGKYIFQQGFIEEATYLALEFLRKVGEKYVEDSVYEDDEFDCDDFSSNLAIELLQEIIKSPTITNDERIEIARKLEELDKLETYANYHTTGLEHIVEGIYIMALTEEAYVDRIYQKIEEIEDDDQCEKLEYIIKLLNYYIEKELYDKADELVKANRDYPQIIDIYSRYLLDKQMFVKALEILDCGIANIDFKDYRQSLWKIKRLEIYEYFGDKAKIIEQSRELFLSAYVSFTYYEKLKKLIDPVEWNTYLDKLLDDKDFDKDNACGDYSKILYAEKRYEELFTLLDGTDVNLLSALECYANKLSEEQQRVLIIKIADELRRFAREQMGRENYYDLVRRLTKLRECCEVGKEQSAMLVEEFRATYKNRRAMLEELSRL